MNLKPMSILVAATLAACAQPPKTGATSEAASAQDDGGSSTPPGCSPGPGTPPGSPADAGSASNPPSPSCTTITQPGQSILDSAGNTWTLEGPSTDLRVDMNGQPAGVTGVVTRLVYVNDVVSQQNVYGDWWSWGSNTWNAESDPTGPCGTAADPCAGQTCGGHGSCSSTSGTATCQCDSGYHASGLACVSDQTPLPTFSDDFSSYNSNLWYRNSFDEGGDSFWTNDPSLTDSIYTFSDGKLNLGLLPTPSGTSITKPFMSGIMDTYNAPNHFAQQYGYFEVVVAVDKLIGEIYECVVLSPLNFPPAFSTRIWTDSNNVQHLDMFAYANGIMYSTDNTAGFDPSVSHAYGLNWTASNIDFYVDRVQVASFANPGGAFTNGDPAYTKMHVNAHFSVAPAVVDTGALPIFAHIDSYNVWLTKPF